MKLKKTINNNKIFLKQRRDGRVVAFQTLFSWDISKKPIDELLKFDWLDKKYNTNSIEYAVFLIKGVIDNLNIIDEKIKSKLRNWDLERISNIDKSILRFSVFSLLFEKDLSCNVVINEAVEIVKLFGNEDSYKFVNGILDAITKSEKNSR